MNGRSSTFGGMFGYTLLVLLWSIGAAAFLIDLFFVGSIIAAQKGIYPQ